MKFGEKVRAARLAAKYSQRQLADMTGIALRTIQNYESGERLPKQKENYQLLATALNVDVDALKDDDADFVIKATEKYGARGNAQAERLVKEVSGLYAGGELAKSVCRMHLTINHFIVTEQYTESESEDYPNGES